MTTNDNQHKNDGTRRRQQRLLSDETAEEIKGSILYGVGYKRPPKHTRFKKGQSGNPKGRPKQIDIGFGGSRSANALALKAALRPVNLDDGTGTRQVPAIEAIYHAQYAAAAKGNAYAQKIIIERHDQAERARRREIMESNAFWRDYVDKCRDAIAVIERCGQTPPALFPHPDDVVIEHERGVRFIGPLNEEQAAELEETCKLRDVLIIQDALDQRQADDADTEDHPDRPGTALLFAVILNQRIPARYRLSDIEITLRADRYAVMRKRDLLKTLHGAWRAISAHPPRGMTFPPLRAGKETVDLLFDLAQRSMDGRLDVTGSTPEELAAAIDEVIRERRQGVEDNAARRGG